MAKRPPDKLASNKIRISTQKYLDISEIKEDTVILKDGGMRAILMVSSINFALKSEDEQNALVAAYVGFLNNLDFPFQIVIQSRELDMDNYIKDLRQKEKEQTNELLKIQMAEHTQYIEELISIGRIMNKRFYAVIPFSPGLDKHKSFFASLSDAFKPTILIKIKEKIFWKRRDELTKRVDRVKAGLTSVGLTTVELDTQALIELFYNTYNPVTSASEKISNIDDMRVVK